MFTLFYRNPRLLILTIGLILVAGLSSFKILPRQEDPELVRRYAIIKVHLPGAKAERVESLVTEKVEEKIAEIEEVKHIISTSHKGLATLQVELKDRLGARQVEEVWSRLRNKLRDAVPLLPPGTSEPEFESLEARAYGMIVALVWKGSGKANLSQMRRRAKDLEQALWGVGGTEKIDFFGEPLEEILVELNPGALTSLGLTAKEVSEQIRQSDAKVAAGQFQSDKNQMLVEVKSELDSLKRIGAIPIRYGKKGVVVYLGDLAKIKKTLASPPESLSLVRGKPALMVALHVESGRRIDYWAQKIHKKLVDFQSQLPGSLSLEVIFDQSGYTESRLANLLQNLMVGCFLVALVVFLMMGWKSALIVSIALPLSALMVLFGLRVLGIPIHQMSVAGLIIALGLLIDNAIVVVDEVQIRLGEGYSSLQAISESVSYLLVPLLGSTLTTVLTFMPIALMPGGAGEFVSSMAISVILALFSSLLLSLTVIAALTGWFHRPLLRSSSPSRLASGFSFQGLSRLYQWSLEGLFRKPLWGIGLGLLLPLLGFLSFFHLNEQFFPPSQRDQLQIEVELPPLSAIAQTRSLALEVRQTLLQNPQIEEAHWVLGRSAPTFYYNLPKGKEGAPQYAQALVQLKSAKDTERLVNALQGELNQAFPQARILVRQLEQGPPVPAPVEIRLYGADLRILDQWGDRIRQDLANLPQITHVRSSLSEVSPKVEFLLTEEKVRLRGLNYTAIANQLQGRLEGNRGGSLLEGSEELPVRVRLPGGQRKDLDQIASQNIITPSGASVPLSSLGKVHLVPEYSAIHRRNRRRYNTVQAFVQAGVLPSRVLNQFKPRLKEISRHLPLGYTCQLGGEAEGRNDAVGNLVTSLGLLAALMVVTLVLSFNSFRLAGLIGVVGILSVGHGIFSLYLFGFPFGFMAIVGTMGLIGVAINDSIVVLAALQEDSQSNQGDPSAVARVVIRSTRHVLATTLTTIAGFIPLLLGGGAFWPPVAVSIGGGVGGATLLALYFVPSAYILLMCRGKCQDLLKSPAEEKEDPSIPLPTVS